MSDVEEKEVVEGEEITEGDGIQTSDFENMTPEERNAVIRGEDPDAVADPELETSEEGEPAAKGDDPVSKVVPGEPLSEEVLKTLSPQDPDISDKDRARHPALREARRKQKEAERREQRKEKENTQLRADFEELKASFEKGTQTPEPAADGAKRRELPPGLSEMDPESFYGLFFDEMSESEKRVAKTVIETLKEGGFLPEKATEPPAPALTFDDGEVLGYKTSINLEREGVEITDNEEGQIEDEFLRTGALYVNLKKRNKLGQDVSFEVFDEQALLDLDNEARAAFGDVWPLMWASPDPKLDEKDPLRAGGLLTQLGLTDYPAYLAILASPDPLGAMGVKFKELYEKTGGKVKAPPKVPVVRTRVPDDDEPDPVGLPPGSTTGGSVQGSGIRVDAETLSVAEMAGLTKEQKDQAVREGVVDIP